MSAAAGLDRAVVAAHARRFSAARFDSELGRWLDGEVIDVDRGSSLSKVAA